MPEPPRIRAARIEEAAALSELCFQSKAVWGYGAAFMSQALEALAIDRAEISAGDVWVATVEDGEIAGVVVLAAGERSDTLDLNKLFVAPQHIRSGVGRVLLAHAVNKARQRGARRLTILADPNAAAFYERSGARLVGQAPSDAIPGRMLPLYEMILVRAAS